MKLSDYVFNYLYEYGIKDVFLITGGGAMHLNDSIGRNPDLNYYCFAHEQGLAIAAEGYARISGKLAVCNVTSGPGGTNCLTGVIGQWLDSVPVLYISGQIKRETMAASYPHLNLRQLGDQEINITDIVKPVTKYAHCVTEPESIRYHLEKAIHLATGGRPGPVWLDIPLDVQAASIEADMLRGFSAEEKPQLPVLKNADIIQAINTFEHSNRPVIVAGNGIRTSGSVDDLQRLIGKLNVPVVTSFLGADLVSTDNPCYIGRIGTIGTRAGNFALQNADVVLFLGTRNNIRQAGYNYADFAAEAVKIVVDIDDAELSKPTVHADVQINADVGQVIAALLRSDIKLDETVRQWRERCICIKKRFDCEERELLSGVAGIDPYYFTEIITGALEEDAVVVTANATPSITCFQKAKIRCGQRYLWNSGCAAMGYDLPAAIGASLAAPSRQVVCLAGDGSIQMNIQELQTIATYNLPIKIFVLNNDGYVSIKQTQDNLFERRRVGCDAETKVKSPDFGCLASAYGIRPMRLQHKDGLVVGINDALRTDGPVLCEVFLPAEYIFSPKSASKKLTDGRIVSRPLEDMFPFLPEDEVKKINEFLGGKNVD